MCIPIMLFVKSGCQWRRKKHRELVTIVLSISYLIIISFIVKNYSMTIYIPNNNRGKPEGQ